MQRTYQFLAKVKGTTTGKLLDSLPWNDAVAKLYSSKFNAAYFRDPERKLPTPLSYRYVGRMKGEYANMNMSSKSR
jgi:hypothetical protein